MGNSTLTAIISRGATAAKTLLVTGAFLALWAQPGPVPAGGNASCPSGPGSDDASVALDSGFYSIFDGKDFKGWWESCQSGHSAGTNTGGIFLVSADLKAIYSNEDKGVGGLLMTNKKYGNYEIIFDTWPHIGNDAGLFNRTNEKGDSYQTVLDYISGGSIGGTWHEAGYKAVGDNRPFTIKQNGDVLSGVGINTNANISWTVFTSKLKPGPTSFGCAAATGCTADDFMKLWNANGWNQFRVKFYGGTAAGKGNVHMFSWFRKVVDGAALPWVPVWFDSSVSQVTPPNYIGLQVHGYSRWSTNPAGTWYRNIKIRELDDKGQPVGVTAVAPRAGSAAQGLRATEDALIGSVDADHEITVRSLDGRVVEKFSGRAGEIHHAFTSAAQGVLIVDLTTSRGTEHFRVSRIAR